MKTFQIILVSLSIAAITISTTSCNQSKIDNLEQELASLKAEKERTDSLQNNFFKVINRIENTVNAIKTKELILKEKTIEPNTEPSEQIVKDLEEIAKMMEQNRKRIAQLQSIKKQLANANLDIANYEKIISELQKRVEEQENTIFAMNEQLQRANDTIAALTEINRIIAEDNNVKDKILSEHDAAFNTVYFAIGTSKELLEKEIITKKGGFIGIGRTAVINPEIDNNNLLKADRRTMLEVETLSSKPILITPHEVNSYEWDLSDNKNVKLVIKDIQEFWKNSKYLIIQVK
jgi:DNA repair exonuclease SbcCD ATPase subunit